tara:strand:+ start:142 stop:387 length:246 start_codon:yes stop_codon:yes gene_type:complete
MGKVKNISFEYEFISEEDKQKVLEAQLRELETAHFSLITIEPSQLQEPQQHLQWKQQKTSLEHNIKKLRNKRSQMFINDTK